MPKGKTQIVTFPLKGKQSAFQPEYVFLNNRPQQLPSMASSVTIPILLGFIVSPAISGISQEANPKLCCCQKGKVAPEAWQG